LQIIFNSLAIAQSKRGEIIFVFVIRNYKQVFVFSLESSKMDSTIKVPPKEVNTLDASPNAAGPSKANCLAQLAQVHRLKNSEENYDNHQYNLRMSMLRRELGMGMPLKMSMELHACRQIKRLPFLQSSNLMEDVLLGRDEEISFADKFGRPENFEGMRNPHVVMEKSLGLL